MRLISLEPPSAAPAASPAPPPVAPSSGPAQPEIVARPSSVTHAAPKEARSGVQTPKPSPGLSEQEASELLNEAAKGLVDQPQGSLALCERVLRDHPMNPRAYALKTTALYGLGRYQEMPGVLDAGKENGVKPIQYLAFGHFTAMLREERRERRLPSEVRESLVTELPVGSLRPGQRQLVQRPSRD